MMAHCVHTCIMSIKTRLIGQGNDLYIGQWSSRARIPPYDNYVTTSLQYVYYYIISSYVLIKLTYNFYININKFVIYFVYITL